MDKLSNQETEFDKLTEDTKQLRAQEADQSKAIADYLKGLDV